jgi:Fe2+ transport system protein FeoA
MDVKLLSKLGHGEKGRIVKIRGEAAMHRLLYDLGLVVGRTISVEKANVNLLGDLIEVRVKTRLLSLEKDVAANIQVDVA